MFVAGSGAQIITASAASFLRATLSNPAGSGRIIAVKKLDITCNVALAQIRVFTDPTVGLPASGSTKPSWNQNVGGASNLPSKGVAAIDLVPQTVVGPPVVTNVALAAGSGPTGGVDTGTVFGLSTGAHDVFEFSPILLHPGHILGLGANFAAAVNLTMNLYWMEYDGV